MTKMNWGARRAPSLLAALSLVVSVSCVDDGDVGDEEIQQDDDAQDDEAAPDEAFRYSTPWPGIETLVTSANADANGSNGGCMDTSPSGEPRPLQQYPCHAGDNQRWEFEDMGGGQFRIHSVDDDDLCIDVPNSNLASGQNLQLYECHNGNNQRWVVVPGVSTATIRPAGNQNLCMDVENAVKTNLAAIQLYGCHGGSNQAWKFHDYVDDDSSSCNGTVRFGAGGPTVSAGQRRSFSSSATDIICSDTLPFGHDTLGCSGFDWLVVDRSDGAGSFDIFCFDV